MGATTHLLDLQALDLAIDRLRSRRAAIESGAELTAARAEADTAEARFGEHKLQIDTLDRDATKVEHEIDSLSQKAAAEEQRMSSGAIANARELEAIGHEITNLKRRIGDREDELLAIMERREAIEAGAREAEAVATERRAAAEQVAAASADELGCRRDRARGARGRATFARRDDRSRHPGAVRRTPTPEEGRGRRGADRQRLPGLSRAAVLRRARPCPAR